MTDKATNRDALFGECVAALKEMLSWNCQSPNEVVAAACTRARAILARIEEIEKMPRQS